MRAVYTSCLQEGAKIRDLEDRLQDVEAEQVS